MRKFELAGMRRVRSSVNKVLRYLDDLSAFGAEIQMLDEAGKVSTSITPAAEE